MNADRLLDHYEKIADAPDAIPSLRRFILDLAVRGTLVPQDPNDEPAAELLERITAEKARLVKTGEIKKQSALPPVAPSEEPFSVPNVWEWTRIGSTAYVEMGQSPPSEHYNRAGHGIPFFQGKADFGKRYPTARYWCTQPKKYAAQGDILISVRAPVGPTNLASEPCCIGRGLAALRSHNGIDRYFLLRCLEAFEHELAALGFGTTFVAINKNQLTGFVIPLPPLAEQHRIVAKVDELMALCDLLEAARTERETTRDRLTTASLDRLNAPDPDLGVFQNHAAFALDNLIPLTTRPDQIKALRQTILNLAVRGKLVKQDPNDEPASELLKEIEADRRKRSRSKRGHTPLGPTESQKEQWPYGIPETWVWAPFGHITISLDGERIPVSKEERSRRPKLYDYYGASGVIDKIDDYLFDKPLLLIGEDGANLINRSTPIAFIARGKYWVNNHAHVLDGLSEEFLRYIELFINAIDLKPYVTGTAQPKMNQAKMNSIPVALPPLAEQHRIVAKVDELMVLCDRLEASLASGDDTRCRLLDALLHETLAPSEEESGSIISTIAQKSAGQTARITQSADRAKIGWDVT